MNTYNNPFEKPMMPTDPQPGYQNWSAPSPVFGPASVSPQTSMFQRQPSMLTGRMVKSDEEILPNEVPMNGTIAFFPTNDCMTIYAKQWTRDGTIATARYVLDVQTKPEQSGTDESFQEEIRQRLDKIEGMLKNRGNNRYHNRPDKPNKTEEQK